MSDRALAWWRALDVRAVDPVPAALTLGLLAHATPAWTEHHVALLDRLAAAVPSEDPAGALVTHSVRALVGGAAASPAATAALAERLAGAWDAEPVRGARVALALTLHDRLHGTGLHHAGFAAWWRSAEPHVTAGDAAEVAALLVAGAPDAARDLVERAPDGGPRRLVRRELGLPGTAGPDDDAWSAAADLTAAGSVERLVAAPLAACPQIVDVDVTRVGLRRAEWWRECLLLTLVPVDADPGVRTQFRLVGAEPRVWCQTGIDGATTDVTGQGVVIRAPLVPGDLEFTPGSY